MSTTTTVGPDVATLHGLVVTETFTGRSQMGYATSPYPIGFVLIVKMLAQTNVYNGMGPRHPKAALIEVPAGTVAGEVLTAEQLAAGIATAKAKQAAVPGQIAAREAQRKAALAADPPLTAEERKAIRAMLKTKPAA
jgi:hypothetical protein